MKNSNVRVLACLTHVILASGVRGFRVPAHLRWRPWPDLRPPSAILIVDRVISNGSGFPSAPFFRLQIGVSLTIFDPKSHVKVTYTRMRFGRSKIGLSLYRIYYTTTGWGAFDVSNSHTAGTQNWSESLRRSYPFCVKCAKTAPERQILTSNRF